MQTEEIEQQLKLIQDRNKRVEGDKAWEVSWVRRVSIMAMTYAIAEVWLLIINEPNSWLKAIVPVVGYLLSTLSLPQIKKRWITK